MEPVSEAARREMHTFLSFVSGAENERAIAARTFHVTATYDESDFAALADRLAAADATGSFSILARDLDDLGGTVAALDEAGHEVVLHGLRHTSFGDVDYDTAHDELSRALDRFEDTAGVRPTGFHVPFMETSAGTLRAADELGIDWLLGRTEADVPAGLTRLDPVAPWDTRLLEGGTDPDDAFEQLAGAPATDEVFLMHPNLHEYYGANAAFDAWLDDRSPTTVAAAIKGNGAGVVLDCVKPIRAE